MLTSLREHIHFSIHKYIGLCTHYVHYDYKFEKVQIFFLTNNECEVNYRAIR